MTKDQWIEFANILRAEYFDKFSDKETCECSNSGDPGEGCDCE